jgi:hypothetical protein
MKPPSHFRTYFLGDPQGITPWATRSLPPSPFVAAGPFR